MAPSLENEVALTKWHHANDLLRLQNHSTDTTHFMDPLFNTKDWLFALSSELSLLEESWEVEGQAVGEKGIMFAITVSMVEKFVQAS
jgi:hypothetical protein